MSDSFCGWAWADRQRLVHGIAPGGQEMFVTVDRLDCYTDGCRSVVLLQEKVKRDA